MTAPPDDTIADTSAIIAALRAERDAALSEKAVLAEALAARNSEFGERIEYQAATLDVLRAMSASPGDPQPVFDLIVERARDLCEGYGATVYEFDGTLIHYRAATGVSEDARVREQVVTMYPMPPTRYTGAGRAILDRRIVRIDDLELESGLHPILRRQDAKSAVALPLLRGDVAVGALSLGSRERGGFSESQIELLQTFAEQAVIAIISAETYRALQERTEELAQRNSEYGERIEHQSATIDVLKVMSASPGDAQPVFNLIVRRARELCNGEGAGLLEFDGELVHSRAWHGQDRAAIRAYSSLFPMSPSRASIACRAIIDGQVIHIRDAHAEPELLQIVRDSGLQSLLALPLLRDGKAIGAIALNALDPGGFSDTQVALLHTFAEQAVIAIASAQTYRALQGRTSDLQEALEYQTATSDVLKVISRSTSDLRPVLDTVVQTAARLCDADQVLLNHREGNGFILSANFGFPPEYEAAYRSRAISYRSDNPSVAARSVREKHPVHIRDVASVPGYPQDAISVGRQRTSLGVPLLREGEPIGVIVLARQRVEPFTDRQIELVSTFADQAVIAIENARLISEQHEALEQQTATAEVLQVINSTPGDLAPVFDTMLDKAMRLCSIAFGMMTTFDGERFHPVCWRGLPTALSKYFAEGGGPSGSSGMHAKLIGGALLVHVADMKDEETYRAGYPARRALVDLGGARTGLAIPLRKEGVLLGTFMLYRQEVRLFSDKEIALLQSFATQAVIAMENARLLTETREALEQQTATAEVLGVINASPGNLTPVFDAILEKAHNLCSAYHGSLYIGEGEVFRAVAVRGMPDAFADLIRNPFRPGPNHPVQRLVAGAPFAEVHDASTTDDPIVQKVLKLAGMRSALFVALRKDKALLGYVVATSPEVRAFGNKHVALLQNFAAQAVIAMENARLLDQIRQRQAELRVTFDNMGDGVVMFDAEHRLAAWNRNFQELLDIPDAALAERLSYADYLRLLAERGEFGTEDVEAELARRLRDTDQELRLERTRPDGRVIEVRRNAVPDGGFVLIYSDITERKRSEAEIRAARDAAEAAYRDLKTAQANLIQAEKMASLGQLTAGIAHEIKNPLNFVNNFAVLSVDLLSELKATAAPGFAALSEKQRAEIEEVSAMLTSNLEKINEHGKRADNIVKAMLEHSRGSSGERRMVDLSTLIDDALNLAYHGARAQDQTFNITLEQDFGAGIAPIEVNPQDITRVFLNIFSNGFYAANKRARKGADAGFMPTLKVTTRDAGEAVEVRVRDNGTGIPDDIKDNLFQPFFTTKPTGEGTGLGLSITYDIVTQQHGGSIAVDSKFGEYSEFVIRLPRNL